MSVKSKYFRTNFAKVDATPAIPDDEIPEVTKEMMDRGTLSIGGVVIRGPKTPGRPAGSGRKEAIHIMLDKDVLAYYRSTGPGWQTRMNAALRTHLPKRAQPKKRASAGKR